MRTLDTTYILAPQQVVSCDTSGEDEGCNGETDSMGIDDNDNNNDYEKNVGIKSNSSNVLSYNMSVLSGGLKRVQSFMNASRAFSTTAASSVPGRARAWRPRRSCCCICRAS